MKSSESLLEHFADFQQLSQNFGNTLCSQTPSNDFRDHIEPDAEPQ